MFHEYALDPGVLTSWERVRTFLDAFGPAKGRFLVDLPRKGWKQLVMDAVAAHGCSALDRSRIEEKLRRVDKRTLLPRKDQVAPVPGPWVATARAEHARDPLRAIITPEPLAGQADEIAPDDCHGDASPWHVPHGCLVPRKATELSDRCRVLVRASKRVILVDPYFNVSRAQVSAVLTPLARLVAKAGASLEVHARDEKGHAEALRATQRALPASVPIGFEVTVRWLAAATSTHRHHNRYLLTEIGGVQLGDSAEEGDAGHEDRWSILDTDAHERLWKRHTELGAGFQEAGPACTVRGTRPG